MSKALHLYQENQKLYKKLSSTKSVIPSIERLSKDEARKRALQKKMSAFVISINTDSSKLNILQKRKSVVDSLHLKKDKIRIRPKEDPMVRLYESKYGQQIL